MCRRASGNVNIVNTGRSADAATSLFAPACSSSSRATQARALTSRVLSFAKADETRVKIIERLERQHTLRRRRDHDVSGGITDTTVTVTVTIGKRRASVIDQRARRRVATPHGRSGRAPGASWRPKIRRSCRSSGRRRTRRSTASSTATADLDAEARAAATKRVIERCDRRRGSRQATIFVAGLPRGERRARSP